MTGRLLLRYDWLATMGTATKLIPAKVLDLFFQQFADCKILVVSVSGPHAFGYPSPKSPIELKGLHVEPTENLIGLNDPPKALNWVGEFHGVLIDYASYELGQGLKRLLKGDGSVLERILAPRQLKKGEDLRQLQKVTRGIICRRFFHHYRNFSKGVLRDYEEGEQRTVRHLLSAYRLALTGVHLLLSGKVELNLIKLAQKYGFPQVQELVQAYQASETATLHPDDPAINRLVRLHSLLEQAVEQTTLRADPDNPNGVEDYLLDMRRRFFDAPTIQQG